MIMDVITDVSYGPFVSIKYVPWSWLVIKWSSPSLKSEISVDVFYLISYCCLLVSGDKSIHNHCRNFGKYVSKNESKYFISLELT